jgi:pyridoxamine 5'-phosphate oxidase
MKPEPPDFYDSLPLTLEQAWHMLVLGVHKRNHAFHTVSVASIGPDGRPRVRVVVLRKGDATSWQLRFHTDRRADKIAEFQRDSRVAVLAYDPVSKVQVRLEGVAEVHVDDSIADEAWAASRLFSRQCYGVQPQPGKVIDTGNAFALPETTEEATAAGRQNFCAIVVQVQSLEWLYLAASGHRRARFIRQGDDVTSQWLTP